MTSGIDFDNMTSIACGCGSTEFNLVKSQLLVCAVCEKGYMDGKLFDDLDPKVKYGLKINNISDKELCEELAKLYREVSNHANK